MALTTPAADRSNTTEGLFPPPRPSMKKSTEGLQRCRSDVTASIGEKLKELQLSPINEVEQAECECCGMREEYTVGYVGEVKGCHQGKWICGICSADVKEQLAKVEKKGDLEEALSSHMAECRKFNGTMRVNPTLCLAGAMRDIVKRCRVGGGGQKEGRRSGGRVGRTSSCVSRINLERDRVHV